MKQSVAIILIIVAICAIIIYMFYYFNSEGFWDLPSRKVRVEREFTNNGIDFFQSPNYQGVLSPRMSNVNYGPYLRSNMPDYEYQAVPSHPLGDAAGKKMVRFSPDVSDFAPSEFTSTTSYTPSSEIKFPSFKSQTNYDSNPTNQNMSQGGIAPETGVLGMVEAEDGIRRQTMSMNRYMYANKGSRLRNMADPIRGDLPIVPATGNWFVPSVNPNIDLHQGALNVMGGVNNENSHRLAQLVYATSGGTESTIGGVDLLPFGERNGFAQMNNIDLVSRGNDVVATSFP